MARLPQVGSDDGTWGDVLNTFLSVSHNNDGNIKSGAVTKGDVGLGNVDNTSDAAKPVSTATQTALDARPVWVTVAGVGTARPSTSSMVIWVGGTSQPSNMQTGDIWLKEG